jgi:hypothetical protein
MAFRIVSEEKLLQTRDDSALEARPQREKREADSWGYFVDFYDSPATENRKFLSGYPSLSGIKTVQED